MYKPNAIHIMIDCETASLDNNAAIIAIAAVRFYPNISQPPKDLPHFYERIALSSCESCGLHVSKATLVWWETQNLEARLEAFSGSATVEGAMERFRGFLRSFTDNVPEDVILYSRGWKDFAWIQSAFAAVFLDYPIGYRNEIDIRSIEHNVPDYVLESCPLPRSHNALDDCKQQISRFTFLTNAQRFITL